jgi:hypothetical protein
VRYWNQDLDLLEAPELVAATAQAYGAWSRICAYCVRLENGGILRGAASWQARQWAATCRLDPAEVDAALEAGLVVTHGNDLRALFYPQSREQAEQTRRAEGMAAGSVSTPAKAAAARINGQNGGRPRIHIPKTQETHGNPPGNPRETQEKPTGKPTAPAAPSENGSETQGKVIEDKVSGSGFRSVASFPPPTHPPDFVSSRASASPAAQEQAEESDAEWLDRLAREWPRLDVLAEVEAAKRKNPNGFDRPWFESRWLPRANPRIAAAPRPASASLVKPLALPEPDGWRDELAESQFGPGGVFEVRTWAELPADVQKLTAERLRTRPAAHV